MPINMGKTILCSILVIYVSAILMKTPESDSLLNIGVTSDGKRF